MTTDRNVCDAVTERIALGEPLAELSTHAETCADCRALSALPSRLAAGTRHAIEREPAQGFSARMTLGARHRIVARRRQRIAGMVAATAVAGALGVVVVTRTADDPQIATREPAPALQIDPPAPGQELDDDDLTMLVDLARAPRVSARQHKARWQRLTKPLAPYMHLVNGVSP